MNHELPQLGLSRGWAQFSTFDHETSLVSAVASLALHISIFVWFIRRLTSKRTQAGNGNGNGDASIPKRWKNAQQYICSALLLMLAIELPVLLSTPSEGLADLIQGTDPKLNELLARVPAIRRGPLSPLLLRNRHVQFVPWMIQNEIHRARGIPFQRIDVEVSDCADKMEGCVIPHMNDTIALDIFPPFHDDDDDDDDDDDSTSKSTSSYGKHFNKSSPVILFAPGLRCNSQDLPGNSIVRKAYEAGFRSIVVNRRGLVRPLKSPRLNIFGDVDDLEQIYFYVKRELVAPDCAFFLHGISAGTSVTVSALSKWDRRRRVDEKLDDTHNGEQRETTPVFVASVDVVPGYDISKVLNRERFAWPYNDLLMQGVKDHFVIQNEELLRGHDSDAVSRMLGASSLQEIVDASVTFAGYANTTSYYQDINPINEVRDITTPKLVINAADDPCCSIGNLYEQSPYPQHEGKTFAQMIRETERGMVAVSYTGSHAPFVCTRNRWLPFVNDPLTGGWMLNSWADQVSIEYYRAALDIYGDRRFL